MGGWVGGKEAGSPGLSLMAAANKKALFWVQSTCLSLLFVCAKSLQSCSTFCDPMDCSSPGSSAHGDSPGKNTVVGCRALLQGIFPT